MKNLDTIFIPVFWFVFLCIYVFLYGEQIYIQQSFNPITGHTVYTKKAYESFLVGGDLVMYYFLNEGTQYYENGIWKCCRPVYQVIFDGIEKNQVGLGSVMSLAFPLLISYFSALFGELKMFIIPLINCLILYFSLRFLYQTLVKTNLNYNRLVLYSLMINPIWINFLVGINKEILSIFLLCFLLKIVALEKIITLKNSFVFLFLMCFREVHLIIFFLIYSAKKSLKRFFLISIPLFFVLSFVVNGNEILANYTAMFKLQKSYEIFYFLNNLSYNYGLHSITWIFKAIVQIIGLLLNPFLQIIGSGQDIDIYRIFAFIMLVNSILGIIFFKAVKSKEVKNINKSILIVAFSYMIVFYLNPASIIRHLLPLSIIVLFFRRTK